MNVISPPSLDLINYIERFVRFIFAHYTEVGTWFLWLMSYLTVISIPVSIMIIIGIVLSVERLKRIRAREEEIYDKAPEVIAVDKVSKADPVAQGRWRKVLELVESENENDWRQAIVESDIILDEILTKQGYQGESIGEKLKRAEKADFTTLDSAWEAHKVRNEVAHSGSEFVLTKYEAKRVINLFKQVFTEFYYI